MGTERLADRWRVEYRRWVRMLLTWAMVLGLMGSCGSAGLSSPDFGGETQDYEAAVAEAPPAPPMEESADADGSYADESAGAGSPAYGYELATPGVAEIDSPTTIAPGETSHVAESTASADTPEATPAAKGSKHLLLIYRAQLVLAVFETKKTLDRLELLARQLGGYLVHRENESITVRVPVAKFEQGLKDASALGDELSRQVTAEDVSDQYRDLRIRLKNAEVVRERLEALLAKAQDVKEALLVEEQLARVTTTIEQLKGKLKMLDELIAFSTITVTLQAQHTAERLKQRVTLPFPWLRDLGLSNLLDLGAR